jgi:uncharacterized protein YycO
MIYRSTINGIAVRTGDVICVHDGGAPLLEGQFWRFVGSLIPGDVDHVAVYLGPDGRCIEAGPRGVITYEVRNYTWDAAGMRDQRGPVIDQFYGIACPAEGRSLSEADETKVREDVAAYCLAQVGKPYNLNFLNSGTETTFYCSQLVYKAYLRNGIDLNTGAGVPDIPGTESIIFPQEIWSGCVQKR